MNASSRLAAIKILLRPLSDLSQVRVSSQSKVHDSFWKFERKNCPRSIGESKLTVYWDCFSFHPNLTAELQRTFALSFLTPKYLGARSGQFKPNSFCSRVRMFQNFLQAIVSSMPSPDLVSSLSQLKCVDLQRVSKEYQCGDIGGLKQGLKWLFHSNAAKLLGTEFNIRLSDIRNLIFKPRKQSESDDGPLFMEDGLFTLLSDESVVRTQDFLRRMGLPIDDVSCRIEYHPLGCIEGIENFPTVFADYEKWRRGSKNLPGGDLNARTRLERVGVILGHMNRYLTEVNNSAQTVIALYTGGRFSELASFEEGCLDERDGVICVKGTVFKTRPDIEVMDDSWVAIPAVRDAVRALEALSGIKNKQALFTSLETAKGSGLRGSGKPYSGHGLVGMLRRHLSRIDTAGKYSEWKFNTHQFKHSLTRQMIKVKLGLPYISFQLKHLHSRVASLPSDVTLGYGNAARLLQSEMAGFHLQEVKRAISRKVYDPDSPIAGGGAEKFSEKRKTYFAGMMAAGYTKERILDDLANSGTELFVNVGLGYCTGKKAIDSTGKQPPCIGSLKCNPNQCANALVTKDHAPAWRAVYSDNKMMLADPRLYYGKAEFSAAMNEARNVLSLLGENVTP